MKKQALLLVGHGSKLKGFEAPMKKVAQALQKQYSLVVCSYLEITRPSIEEGIDLLVKKGAAEIVVVPYFLLLGRHVVEDLPEIIRLAKAKHKGKVRIKLAPYIGFHSQIIPVLNDRIRKAK